MKRQAIIFIASIVAVIVIGIITATFIDTKQVQAPTNNSNNTSLSQSILSIRIGTYEKNRQGQQLFNELSRFSVNQGISMRVIADDNLAQTIELPIRLVDSNGQVVNLSPSSITVKSGENKFCCWTIDKPGNYTMQVFKPDNTITPLKITVEKDGQVPAAKPVTTNLL